MKQCKDNRGELRDISSRLSDIKKSVLANARASLNTEASTQEAFFDVHFFGHFKSAINSKKDVGTFSGIHSDIDVVSKLIHCAAMLYFDQSSENEVSI